MGLQDRIIVCGTKLAVYGMILRFLVGPALFAAASYTVGLRGVPLHVSIVQVDFVILSTLKAPFVFDYIFQALVEVLKARMLCLSCRLLYHKALFLLCLQRSTTYTQKF